MPKYDMSKNHESPLHVGNKVFIRAITYHYVGEIVGLTDTEVLLTRASWVAESGRWAQALAKGDLAEVEPYPMEDVVSVARGAIVDVVRWRHDLPTKTK